MGQWQFIKCVQFDGILQDSMKSILSNREASARHFFLSPVKHGANKLQHGIHNFPLVRSFAPFTFATSQMWQSPQHPLVKFGTFYPSDQEVRQQTGTQTVKWCLALCRMTDTTNWSQLDHTLPVCSHTSSLATVALLAGNQWPCPVPAFGVKTYNVWTAWICVIQEL